MNSTELQNKLSEIVANLSKEDFIFEFLKTYGISKTTITRLQKGDFNQSKEKGEILYKSKVFFKAVQSANILSIADECANKDKILKQYPRFVIVTDYKTLVAKDLKSGLNLDIPIKDLPRYFDFFLPLAGAEIYKSTNDNKADRDAAYKLGQLYDILVKDNPEFKTESHSLNTFLSRLLFCFFAEDTGIFEKESVFTDTLAQHTDQDGSDVDLFFNQLFKRLNSSKGKFADWQEQFPYVNGGLFRDDIVCPKFSYKSRKILLECGGLNWSEINPDIFGSMIQAVADPEERSDLGMHYTSVPNIKKLIEPLFLNDLYEAFEKNYDNSKNLQKLIIRISNIKFFDPACGSGNFLIISYKEIRLLEIKIIQRLIELDLKKKQTLIYATSIRLSQFYGIEIKDFAHEMAVLSLWLAEHQMNRVFEDMLGEHGKSQPLLPLKKSGKIECGNAARIDWEIICPRRPEDEIYILGNPPYLGARIQDGEQKRDMDYVFSSFAKYRDLDYISIWVYKAKEYIDGFGAKCAFVSTNSICQGQQVALLWPNVIGGNIELFFAYESFKWTNNAKSNAGVSVIIVGLRNISSKPKFIFGSGVKRIANNINPYLVDGRDVIIYEKNVSLSGFPRMNFGNMPNDGGGLLLTSDEKGKLINTNPQSARFIKPLMGSYEFINGVSRYCLWIEECDLKSALQITYIKDRIEICRRHRVNSKDKGTNKLAERSYQFRDRNVPKESQLLIPSVSSERRKYIPIGILGTDVVISNSAMAVYDADPWLFGVLHSKMHMVWVDAVGGKLKTDYRYSAKLCYNTFPFPEITDKQKATLKQYVLNILDERAKHSEKTIAWMYNPETMPIGLKNAHKELDLAVDQIYKRSSFQSDADRLEHLFKLYEEMIQKDSLFSKQKAVRKKKK